MELLYLSSGPLATRPLLVGSPSYSQLVHNGLSRKIALLSRLLRASPFDRISDDFLGYAVDSLPLACCGASDSFWGTSLSTVYNGSCLSTLLTIVTIVTLIHGKRCLRCHLHFTRDSSQVHAVSTIDRITFHGTHSRHYLCNIMNMTHDNTKAYVFPRAAERKACQSKFCCKPKHLAKLIFPRWDQRLMDWITDLTNRTREEDIRGSLGSVKPPTMPTHSAHISRKAAQTKTLSIQV